MGCGKSSVGRELRTLLGRELIDLDSYIEEREGRSIKEIFETEGESSFRKMELKALEEIVSMDRPLILSLGGGTVTTSECFRIVKSDTTCFYLKASADTLYNNLINDSGSRPMLTGADLRTRINTLLAERESTYQSVADFIIEIDKISYCEITDKIISLIQI